MADAKSEDTINPAADDVAGDPLVGTLLHNKYRLTRRIGIGGFGTVYEARDERGAGNRVAVKVVRSEYSSDPKLVRAFRSEARRMTRLSHPNIVDWKNFDEDENHNCYFVMELVEGEELDRILSRTGPIDPKRAGELLLQILDALRAAHHLADGSSILHLDLKPRNVFVVPARAGRPEQVKVIDFGIGQHIGAEVDDGCDSGGATSPTDTLGDTDFNPSSMHFADASEGDPPGFRRCHGCTPEYVSPEQAAHVLGRPDVLQLDGRADVYSLGVMAFQMLSGELPFAPPIVRTDYLRLHMSAQPRSLVSTRTKVPRALARFVDRCLQKERDDRFRDTDEAFAALESIVRPRGAIRTVVTAVVLVGSVLASAGYWLGRDGPSEVLAAEGVELVPGASLLMGPASRVRTLTSHASDAFDPRTTPRLVDAASGSEIEGAHLVVLTPDRVRLEWNDEIDTQRRSRAVRVEGHKTRFEPFELVWLGRDSWTLGTTRVRGADLGSRVVALDPRGLDLEVSIRGAARDEVAKVAARSSGGIEVEMVPFGVRDDERMFRVDLGLLGLPPGPSRISVHALDRAAGSRDRELEILVVDTALGARAELCEARDDGNCAPFNRMADRFLLSPESRPILRVAPTRPAALEWRLVVDGALLGSEWTRSQTAALHEIPVTPPSPDLDGILRGNLELFVDENEGVVHADTDQRGRMRVSVPFVVSAERADFIAALELPSRERVPLDTETITWIGSHEYSLIVERRGRPAMRLHLDDGRTGELQADKREFRFRSGGVEEGLHAIEMQAFRMDTSEQSFAEAPDVTRRYTFGIDTRRPELTLPTTLDGARFDALAAIPTHVTGREVFDDGGSPVTVRWQLVEESTGHTETGTSRKSDPDLDLRQLFSGDRALHDGHWRLECTAHDEALNLAPSVVARFEVALNGPALEIQGPRVGNWLPEDQGWLVQVRASDPNGVERVACTLQSAVGPPLTQHLERAAGTATDAEFRGHFAVPHAWSARTVSLQIEALDSAGQRNSTSRVGITLPIIQAPRPSALRNRVRSAAILRLIPGNEGAPYVFGGRGDDVENADHRHSGLRAFAQPGAARSWVVNYEAGAIADFYLEEREVTREEYARFLRDDLGYAVPAHWPEGSAQPSEGRRLELLARFEASPDLPATGVNWEEAAAYARWSGLRLPSWIEWEYATRGGPSQYRPFASFRGGPPPPGSINVAGLGPGRAWAAGEGDDVTPLTAIRDLAGNVREWTGTPLAFADPTGSTDRGSFFREHRAVLLSLVGTETCHEFWLAGGSFREENYFFEAAAARPRTWSADHVGFRCALSIEEARKARDASHLEDVR